MRGADFVIVYQCTDSLCNSTILLAQLSGGMSDVKQTYTSTTGYMLVRLTTNLTSNNVSYDGFNASWTSMVCFVCAICYLLCTHSYFE